MNDFAAALGIANLGDFPSNLKRVREIAKFYREELQDVPGLQLLQHRSDRESAYWLFTVLVENRLAFIEKLKERKVPSSVVHLRIDHNSIFGGYTPNLPNQEKFNEKQLSIPIHAALTDDDIQNIVKAVKSGW